MLHHQNASHSVARAIRERPMDPHAQLHSHSVRETRPAKKSLVEQIATLIVLLVLSAALALAAFQFARGIQTGLHCYNLPFEPHHWADCIR